jgi:hypothetical protein
MVAALSPLARELIVLQRCPSTDVLLDGSYLLDGPGTALNEPRLEQSRQHLSLHRGDPPRTSPAADRLRDLVSKHCLGVTSSIGSLAGPGCRGGTASAW